jgi:hypothetical protein
LILVTLATLFLALPTFMAYLFGGLLVWLAAAAGIEAFRRRGPVAEPGVQGSTKRPLDS